MNLKTPSEVVINPAGDGSEAKRQRLEGPNDVAEPLIGPLWASPHYLRDALNKHQGKFDLNNMHDAAEVCHPRSTMFHFWTPPYSKPQAKGV